MIFSQDMKKIESGTLQRRDRDGNELQIEEYGVSLQYNIASAL